MTIGFAGLSMRSHVVSTDETRSAFDIAVHLCRRKDTRHKILRRRNRENSWPHINEAEFPKCANGWSLFVIPERRSPIRSKRLLFCDPGSRFAWPG